METQIVINVLIGDRSFRIKIHPDDEYFVRKIAAQINAKIKEFKHQLAGKDMQDYISMVLLWFVTEKNEFSNNWIEKTALQEALDLIEKKLEDSLKPLS